jgi:hypothetical protein
VLNGFRDAAYAAGTSSNTYLIQAFPGHSGGFSPKYSSALCIPYMLE